MRQHKAPKLLKIQKEMFDSLVRNAIDFLERSVHELENEPKYSVIDFSAALELFLKARLLKEHWSLIVSKIEKVTVQGFQNGDFQSVTIDECLQRLHSVANEALMDHEKVSFRILRDHKNKLSHFFHIGYQTPIDPQVRASIVSEQLKAWFYLHRLLTARWKPHFARYGTQLAHLDRIVRKNEHFLKAKFKAVEPEIIATAATGVKFEKCDLCRFQSAKIVLECKPLSTRSCLVCGWNSPFLTIDCPKCGKVTKLEPPQDGTQCQKCQDAISLDDLLAQLGPIEHPKEESSIAYCSECEHSDLTAVLLNEDDRLCLNCFTLHSGADVCGWCGDLITGHHEDTSIVGCFRCGGPELRDL